MVGAETGAGFPSMRRCEREASLPQRAQIALSFTTTSASASRLGIGPNGSPLKSMSSPATMTSYPASASRRQTSIIPSSKNCASSMATRSVVSSTFPRSSSLVETASASCGTPLWDRVSVFSERVSMVCLKTCALRWAYRARRTRRINSSVLPENIDPVITTRDPVLWVEASTGGSKSCVIVLILPATQPSTGPASLAQFPFGLAAYPPTPDDGDYHYSEDLETRRHQEQGDVLGRPASQVRVEESLGEDTEGRGRNEAPEPHPGEAGGIGDGVEGDARQESSGEYGVHSPPREPVVG